ncbi:hypothetical protein QR680_000779 [Steinernema hermaphroditum]|uniref:Uncharacterized protein n=1 Tax=Steinernema hermaphroditum TaxID=289476 RepID=A0AA39GVV0_9BILA|nr:hypothetical protein QR680_000779 [Steinernema hermaphroditum]
MTTSRALVLPPTCSTMPGKIAFVLWVSASISLLVQNYRAESGMKSSTIMDVASVKWWPSLSAYASMRIYHLELNEECSSIPVGFAVIFLEPLFFVAGKTIIETDAKGRDTWTLYQGICDIVTLILAMFLFVNVAILTEGIIRKQCYGHAIVCSLQIICHLWIVNINLYLAQYASIAVALEYIQFLSIVALWCYKTELQQRYSRLRWKSTKD